jgi:hypothetical protein
MEYPFIFSHQTISLMETILLLSPPTPPSPPLSGHPINAVIHPFFSTNCRKLFYIRSSIKRVTKEQSQINTRSAID